ncbi:MAG: IS3 family transposase [Acidobacteriaceae bacterium]|nr:IS3 family transposase [Acidobacteriaceae bacterium]
MQSQGGLSIQRMCEMATVSRASFYRSWQNKAPTQAEMALRDAIQRIAVTHRFYGYRRIAVLVQREGYEVGAKKVRRLMKEDNLLSVRRRKFVATTDSDHDFVVYPNLAEHVMVNDVNQLWVADITYIRLLTEFVYLAVVLDAFSRRAVGWALGRNLQTSLPLAALENAIRSRQPSPGLIHHSDRGTQYASNDYVKRLENIGAVMSMSRPARPWENGRCESFLKTLKREEINARPYRTMEDLEQHLEEFIEQIYNRVRLHSALGYRSPAEFEQQAQAGATWLPAGLSFRRHQEIYPDDHLLH